MKKDRHNLPLDCERMKAKIRRHAQKHKWFLEQTNRHGDRSIAWLGRTAKEVRQAAKQPMYLHFAQLGYTYQVRLLIDNSKPNPHRRKTR